LEVITNHLQSSEKGDVMGEYKNTYWKASWLLLFIQYYEMKGKYCSSDGENEKCNLKERNYLGNVAVDVYYK
jgi:hypothetical protein